MFETDIEKIIVFTVVVLWVANIFLLNEKLNKVNEKLDTVMKCFDGLKDYLYEIDPQFNDERDCLKSLNDEEDLFSGIRHMELLKQKEEARKRTLTTSFLE